MSGNSPGGQALDDDGLPRTQRPLPPDPGEVAGMHGRLVEVLGSAIALGQLTGTLDPDQIATRFMVSRSVVREALRTLAAKGMVVARQRTGTRVTHPSEWAALDEQVVRWRAAGPGRFGQMLDSLEIRERIEPLAARRMAQAREQPHLDDLCQAADQIEEATRTGDGTLMLVADTAFHRALYLGSGSDLLAEMAATVHACLRVPDFQRFKRFSEQTAPRHHHLASAIANGDADLAEQTCTEVVALTRQLFADAHQQLLRAARPAGLSERPAASRAGDRTSVRGS